MDNERRDRPLSQDALEIMYAQTASHRRHNVNPRPSSPLISSSARRSKTIFADATAGKRPTAMLPWHTEGHEHPCAFAYLEEFLTNVAGKLETVVMVPCMVPVAHDRHEAGQPRAVGCRGCMLDAWQTRSARRKRLRKKEKAPVAKRCNGRAGGSELRALP